MDSTTREQQPTTTPERERDAHCSHRERERERGTRKEKECVNGLDPRADFIRVHEMR